MFRIALALLLAGVASLCAHAQDGTLDPAFTGTGYRVIGYGGDKEDDYANTYPQLRVHNLVVQPDGRILHAIGYHALHNDPATIEITRTLSDGSADPSFSAQTVTGPGGLSSMALQSTGKVLVLAVGFNTHVNDFVVFRYGGGGALDSGWGSGGRLDVPYTLVPGITITPIDILVQADDKVILTGTATTSSNVSYFVALRLSKDGALDNGYGSDNDGQIVVTRFGTLVSAAPTERLHHARLSTKGNLFLGGWTQPNSNGGIFDPPLTKASIAVAKLTPAGVLDGTFGNGGALKYNLDQAGSLGATDIAITRNEGVYALTNATSVMRFLKDGSADPAFGGGVATFTPLDPSNTLPLPTASYGITVQEQDGKVVVTGEADSSGGIYYTMAARLLGNGAPDPDFGTANSGTGVSLLNTDYGGLPFQEGSVLVQQYGQILIGGKVQHGPYSGSGINYVSIIYRLKVDRIFDDGVEAAP